MAKSKSKDIAIDNLKGFFRRGAQFKSPGNIPTGHFALDFGIHFGESPSNIDLDSLEGYDPANPLGVPLGKIVELFGEEGAGKSSLAYRIAGYAQKMGYQCAWIDTEHSFSEQLARINGVDFEDLLYADMANQDEADVAYFAEDVLDAIVNVCKTNADIEKSGGKKLGIIVVDSVANLIPKMRMEADAEKVGVGVLARLMSENMGKIGSFASKYGVTVIFINQIREKIGVMFGCASYSTKVLLSDGTWRKIGPIVNNKEKVEVLSYDTDSGKVLPKKVVDWHNNGALEDGQKFLKIKFHRPFGRGYGYMSLTPNHRVFVPYGDSEKEVDAGTLEVGDSLLVSEPHFLNEVQKQISVGSLLGDGSFQPHWSSKENENANVKLRLGHGSKQKEYCKYKAKAFEESGLITYKYESDDGCYYADTVALAEFQSWDQYKTAHTGKIPDFIPDIADELALAIWYMDDGSFSGNSDKWGNGKCCIYCTKFTNREIMLSVFNRFGLYPKLKDRGFVFNSHDTYKFHQLISRFVPESMNYKIHKDFHMLSESLPNLKYDKKWVIRPRKIVSIEEYEPKHRTKFDLTIDGNSNYFAGGALVHNSPETTPGGRALKFNASLRLRVMKKGGKEADLFADVENGKKKHVGQMARVYLVKNRFAKPYRDDKTKNCIQIPIYFEPYFPDVEEMAFDVARQTKMVRKYKDELIWDDGNIRAESRQLFVDKLTYNDLIDDFICGVAEKAKEHGILLPPELSSKHKDILKKKSSSSNTNTGDNSGKSSKKTSVNRGGQEKADKASE